MITNWTVMLLEEYFFLFLLIAAIATYAIFKIVKLILARSLFFIATHTESDYIDLIVDNLRPFRVAWLMPLGLIYYFLSPFQEIHSTLFNIVFVLIVIESTDFITSLLSGFSDIHKHHRHYTGESIGAYIGILKIIIVIIGIVICVQAFIDFTPGEILAGVGAWLAVVLLIFRDTIINLIASIQISTQKLVKEGDKIIVPTYDVQGFVIDMTLSSIKIQNFDRTLSIIPTHQIVKVPYKNLTAMEESGGRRVKSSLLFNVRSIKFCDRQLLENLVEYHLDTDQVHELIDKFKHRENQKSPKAEEILVHEQNSKVQDPEIFLGQDSVTNLELFMEYARHYLRNNKDIRKKNFVFLVRSLELTPLGQPVEIYVFSKKTAWIDFEDVQGKVMLHLMGIAPYFGLDIFTR